MFTTLIFLACSEKDTVPVDTAEDGPNFQNEEHLSWNQILNSVVSIACWYR